jgi:hypothetical protein
MISYVEAVIKKLECLPSAFFAECGPVPSVLHSVKRLVTEGRTLPSAALGKESDTWQSLGFRW